MSTSKDLNIKVFGLAQRYLVSVLPTGMQEADLDKYFHVDPQDYSTLADVYGRLIGSAQNRNMLPSVIQFWDRSAQVRGLLHDYDLAWISAQTPDAIYELFCNTFPVHNKDSKRNLWRGWSKSVVEGATFLNGFKDVDDFRNFVSCFDYNADTREALPLLVAQRVSGVGFALACDWLKELGYYGYPKPDVHLIDVFCALGLAQDTPHSVFEAVVRMADDCGETPYKVDKVFWLICSGRFYFDEDPDEITPHKADFIEYAKRALSLEDE